MKKNNFTPWFIGFVDAEGNFNISKKKRINKQNIITSTGLGYEFHLSLHQRDLDLINYIQSNINNLGKVYNYENKKEIHLVINNKNKDLEWLIDNIFVKPFLTSHQATKFELFKYGFSNKIKKLSDFHNYDTILNSPIIPDISNCSQYYIDNWIIGFLNGEVSFTYLTKDNKEYPRIVLEHTDEGVINLIKTRLEINTKIITREREMSNLYVKKRKTTHMLFITSNKDINNTIFFINKMNNLQGYKLIQYEEWKNKFIPSGLN